MTVSPAVAETWPDGDGGYPYSNASTVNQTAYDWGYTSCKGYCGTFVYLNGVKYYTMSERGYAIRNCTDYVAWKLEGLGVSPSLTRGRGNGAQWDDNSSGVAITSIPEVGDAAVFNSGTSGHVGFVEQTRPHAGGGYDALISEYNHLGDGSFRDERWVQADDYVDFNGVGNPLGSGYRLVDVDNYGGDDLVLRRGNQWFVDLGADGGNPDRSFSFGDPGDQAFIGNVDGAGWQDLLLRRGNQAFVDLNADGVLDRSFLFGAAGDQIVTQ